MSECKKLNGCKEIQDLRLRLSNSICPHVYEELKAERDDLRANMKNIPTFYKEAAQEMIDTYRYAAEQRIEELESKLTAAQAHNALLVGALKEARTRYLCGGPKEGDIFSFGVYDVIRNAVDRINIVDSHGHCVSCGAFMLDKKGRVKNDKHYPNCEYLKALSTTPSEAYERVQGLVEALEKLARLGGPAGGYGNSIGNTIAQDALQRYRGMIKCD